MRGNTASWKLTSWATHVKYLDESRDDARIIDQLKWHLPQRASNRLELRQPSTIREAAQIWTKMEGYGMQPNQRKCRNDDLVGNPQENWRGNRPDTARNNVPERNKRIQPEEDKKRKNTNLDRCRRRRPPKLDHRIRPVHN